MVHVMPSVLAMNGLGLGFGLCYVVLSAAAAAASAEQATSLSYAVRQGQCAPDGEQCSGAEGFPFVLYRPCCTPGRQCESHPEAVQQPGRLWGMWCLKADQCYSTGERCQGATGYPNHPFRQCCDSKDSCVDHPEASVDEGRWGKFCLPPAGGQCAPALTRCQGEENKPEIQYRPCCNEGYQCMDHPERAQDGTLWGKFCMPPGGRPSYPAIQKKTLIPGKFTADPSAHVIDGKLYVFASTDDPIENYEDPNEMHFLMTRYTIMSFSDDMSQVVDEGEVLPLDSVPWAKKQLWAPDATCKNGKCYLYFPAKDSSDIFRIGVAVSESGPTGPYVAQPDYIQGTYSVDPSVYTDEDGTSYLIWGGEWGGQLENWENETFNAAATRPESGPALQARMAKLSADMLTIEPMQRVRIVDDFGNDILVTDDRKKFFEAAWIHKRNDVYYLSYSTGQTHLLAYAWSLSVMGPYRYGGTIMSPPIGWTSHHSIVAYNDKTYLFYHDSKVSGRTNLRQVKFQEIDYNSDGSIKEVSPE